jgi:hypothetical protein
LFIGLSQVAEGNNHISFNFQVVGVFFAGVGLSQLRLEGGGVKALAAQSGVHRIELGRLRAQEVEVEPPVSQWFWVHSRVMGLHWPVYIGRV